jgi:uncharacterized protein YdeI (YjbR/CyaY-like superfamily)
MVSDLPTIGFASPDAWRDWLAENHASSDGLWMKIAKKDSAQTSVTYPEAVEIALCFGWIDGQSRRLDDDFWLQKFTPRRARSRWSAINRNNATRLIAEGLMQPAGLAQVEAAKADGRWDAAYAPASTATVPDDLAAALDANPVAKEFFATLTGSNRYAIIYRVNDAKRPETRARRIATFVEMLSEGRTIYP